MTNIVSFPGLGLEFEVSRVAFEIGGLSIYWYGVLIALGMLLAVVFVIFKAKSFGVNEDRFIDVIFLTAICAIIGARAYYVIFTWDSYDSFFEMIDVRNGGLAIYGAVIVAFLVAPAFCKWRRIPLLPALDLAAMGFLIGQGIGRWGNFINQEAFGTNTDLPWGMISESTQAYLTNVQPMLEESGVIVDPSLPVHPTFLYESLWCLLGFFLLWAYSKRRKFNGEIALMYFAWYGAERAVVEGLRTDSLNTVFGLRISQVLAIVFAVVAVALWIGMRKKFKNTPLKVTYSFLVYPKRKKSPEQQMTWLASGPMPSKREVIRTYKWTHLPVGVWHI